LITPLSAVTNLLIDPLYTLSIPQQIKILSSPIQNKVAACLATRFNVTKNTVQAIVDLKWPVTQYGRVTCLEGGDLMIGRNLVQLAKDSWDASFIRVELNLDFIHMISDHFFFSIPNLWIDMLVKKEEFHNLSFKISLVS